ncbi:MAG: CDP-alcohol phosphatidyltransferase family protein [Alphaproteobacteria bacterium]|nr:CDP-alcohol phosphatidyltransferase family protein [Alphaproteobacteria bacterium]
MLDGLAHRLYTPPLNWFARQCIKRNITPDKLTIVGFVFGIAAAFLVALSLPLMALIAIGANRFLDGLDGNLARKIGTSDRGGFLDITCDFLFYASMPLGFAFMNAESNALPAAFVIFSFIGTGSSFLAYAIFAEKHKIPVRMAKSFHYLGGLTEAVETIAFFVLSCLFPAYFPVFAYIFGSLCLLTTAMRIYTGYTRFPDRQSTQALLTDNKQQSTD